MPIESLANFTAEVPYGGNLTRVLGSQKARGYVPTLVSQGHMPGVLGPTQFKGVCSVNSAAVVAAAD